jgi:hypothetical protein
MESWQVWRFDTGKATHWEEYLDRAEALEAAGLSETLTPIPDLRFAGFCNARYAEVRRIRLTSPRAHRSYRVS